MAWLLLAFVVVPVAELALLIQIGTQVGVLPTLLLVLFTAVVGARLAQQQGLQVMQRFQRSMSVGELPTQAMMDGAFLLAAGAFLLTPGFITDLFGFLCLLPPARRRMQRWLAERLQGRIQVMTVHYGSMPGQGGRDAQGFDRRTGGGPLDPVIDADSSPADRVSTRSPGS